MQKKSTRSFTEIQVFRLRKSQFFRNFDGVRARYAEEEVIEMYLDEDSEGFKDENDDFIREFRAKDELSEVPKTADLGP